MKRHKKKLISLPQNENWETVVKPECDLLLDKWTCPISQQLPILPVRPLFSDTKSYFDSETLMNYINSTHNYTDPTTRQSIYCDPTRKYVLLIPFSEQFNNDITKLFQKYSPATKDKIKDYLWKDHLEAIRKEIAFDRLLFVENHFDEN